MHLVQEIDAIRQNLADILEQAEILAEDVFRLARQACKLAIHNIGHDRAAAAALDVLEQLPGAARYALFLGKGIDMTQGYVDGIGFIADPDALPAISRNRSGEIRHRKAVSLLLQALWKEQNWDRLFRGQINITRTQRVQVNDMGTLRREIAAIIKKIDRRPDGELAGSTEAEAVEACKRLLQEALKAVSC